MTDTESDMDDAEETDSLPDLDASGRDPSGGSDAGTGSPGGGLSVPQYLYLGTVAVLALLALIATWRFYTSASKAITVWIAAEYEPLFQSEFNLAIVVACALGLSVLLRRLPDSLSRI